MGLREGRGGLHGIGQRGEGCAWWQRNTGMVDEGRAVEASKGRVGEERRMDLHYEKKNEHLFLNSSLLLCLVAMALID